MATKTVSITLMGYMSVADAEKLKADMTNALSTQPEKIKLDITQLEDIDVSTIQLLYAFYKEASGKTSIDIVGKMSSSVKECLYNCGITTDIDTKDDIIMKALKNILEVVL